jgi:hypothetical protein
MVVGLVLHGGSCCGYAFEVISKKLLKILMRLSQVNSETPSRGFKRSQVHDFSNVCQLLSSVLDVT